MDRSRLEGKIQMEALDDIVEAAVAVCQNREELWVGILAEVARADVCEIGVWSGEFAEKILATVDGIRSYRLVDPWRHLEDWNKPGNVPQPRFDAIRRRALERLSPFKDKLIELRGTTLEVRGNIPDGALDFVYVDGDHSLRGITIDLISMLPKLKPHGLIAGDDFTKSIWQHGKKFSPTEVFPYAIYFAQANELTIYALPFCQFLIVNDPSGYRLVDHAKLGALRPEDIYLSSPH